MELLLQGLPLSKNILTVVTGISVFSSTLFSSAKTPFSIVRGSVYRPSLDTLIRRGFDVFYNTKWRKTFQLLYTKFAGWLIRLFKMAE